MITNPVSKLHQDSGIDKTIDAPARAPAQTHVWVWLVVCAAVLGGGYAAYRYFSSGSGSQAKATAAEARPVPVVAVAARKGDMPIYLNGLGNVTALNTVTVRSRVDGVLQSVNFEEGQLVTAGQQLGQIDPRPYEVQLAQVQGQYARDEATLKNAQIELERDKQAAEAIPKQTVDTQQATVDQLQAALKIDQAQIDNVQLQLTYCKITAEITGRIGLRMVDKGNLIHANDPNGMAVITQLQPIAVIFSISEDNLHLVMQNPNRGVGLTADAYDRSFRRKLATGTLAAVDNQVDASTGSVHIKAVFSNDNNELFSNQFVNVRLLVNTLHDAVIVPAPAVQRGPDSTFVYVVKDEKVEVRNVTPDATEGDEIVINKGLAAGEMVVTEGVDRLQAGAKVTVRAAGVGNAASTQPAATTP